MKALIFKLKGKYAHFKKVYSNSSSLSYYVPPRTTVEGIIAAMLGLPRDSYYEKLHSSNVKIAMVNESYIRKITQTLNYIKVTSNKHFHNPKSHTQIPFEVLTDADDNQLSFKIIVYFADENIHNELQKRMTTNKFVYPISLGTAFFSCHVEFLGIGDLENKTSNNYIKTSCVVPTSEIKKINVLAMNGQEIIKETMPRDFKKKRKIDKLQKYIVLKRFGKLEIKTTNYYELNYKNNKEHILFM